MLGSLARKLRALGFETAYRRGSSDARVIGSALKGGMVVLTADRDLARRATSSGASCVLLEERSDSGRLRRISVASAEGAFSLSRGGSRCSECGGVLRVTKKEALHVSIPSGVLRSHRDFLVCRACGKVYWKGSHWKKLRSMARYLK